MAFELPETIYSPQLLEMVIFDLEKYIEWEREGRVKSKVGVPDAVTEPNHSAETLEVIKSWQTAHPTPEATLIQLLEALKELKLPVVHVTLAALPNHLQRESLVRWFQTLSSPRPLILFTSDRTLGGGLILRTPNHIYDFSFRQKLEDTRANLVKGLANA